MIPQGSVTLNTTYFSNLTNSINGAQSCAELQALVTEAFASVGSVKSAITSELATVEPMLALLTINPADLPSVITFIQTLVTAYLTPILKPAVTYAAQLTALAAQITALMAAITSAEARFTSCSISIPSI